MLCLQRTQGHAPGRRGFRLQGGESKHAVLWKARLLELSSSVAEKALYITQTFKELTRNWIVWCQLIPLFIDNPILTKEERGAWGKHKEVLNRGEWWGGEGVVYLNLQPGRTGRKFSLLILKSGHVVRVISWSQNLLQGTPCSFTGCKTTCVCAIRKEQTTPCRAAIGK